MTEQIILVTGGTGFIGSHTVVELLEKNYKVIVIDNLYNSKISVVDRIKKITNKDFKFYNIDMLNSSALETVFKENNINSVIHFAGLKAVGESVQKPLFYYRTNLETTFNLIELMQKYNVNNLVFSSSATVYGDINKAPFKETDPLTTTNPYGSTKLIIENILRDVQKSNNNLNIALLRYFNPIGAHSSGMIGEDPQGIPNNLVPYISQVGSGIRKNLNIYGNDYNTKDGTGVRDYIHVVDLSLGHILALEKLHKENVGCQAYNLGSGKGYSVLDVVKSYEKALQKTIPYNIAQRREGDIDISFADVSKAEIELSFKTIKTLDDMCKDTVKWQKFAQTLE